MRTTTKTFNQLNQSRSNVVNLIILRLIFTRKLFQVGYSGTLSKTTNQNLLFVKAYFSDEKS